MKRVLRQPDIRHVIFDWSGTLFDDHRISFPATRQTVRHLCGKSITYKEYKQHFVLPVDKFYNRYNPSVPIHEIDRYYFEAFAQHAHLGCVFPGVVETLKQLKKMGITVSLYSTVRQDILERLCQITRLGSYISYVHGSVFNKTRDLPAHLKKVRAKPEHTLFIGDMGHDVEAAHQQGVLSGCVLNGYQGPEQLIPHKPRFVWADQRDWLPFFHRLANPLPQKVARDHPVSTVGALVVNRRGEVLVVLTPKWSYTYGIPGGKIDKGESARAAVIRELREETGLEIRPRELFLTQDCIDSEEFYIPKSHFLLLNYVAKCRPGSVRLNDEAVSYLWVQPKLALKLRLNLPTRRLLEAYLRAV